MSKVDHMLWRRSVAIKVNDDVYTFFNPISTVQQQRGLYIVVRESSTDPADWWCQLRSLNDLSELDAMQKHQVKRLLNRA